jgi:hypothetical protein
MPATRISCRKIGPWEESTGAKRPNVIAAKPLRRSRSTESCRRTMNEIRRVMSAQAVRTWNRTRDSARLNFATGEETLTDMLLLDTHKADPIHFRMRKHTHREESESGADWEGWVFASSSESATPVRVQAKRMYRRGVFRELDTPEQIEKLIRNAEGERALSLISLYCYKRPTRPAAWCCTWRHLKGFRPSG